MQSPTPPTKPTPPTPPSMKTTSSTPSADTHSASTIAKPPQSAVAPTKETTTTPEKDQPAAIPAAFSTSSSTKDTTAESVIPAAIPVAKNPPSSLGFNVFFPMLLVVAVSFVALYWWKNNKPVTKTRIDYSSESSEDIVKLILSPDTLDSPSPAAPKIASKKPLPKTDTTTRPKGGFDFKV